MDWWYTENMEYKTGQVFHYKMSLVYIYNTIKTYPISSYEVPSISFHPFFVQEFKIVLDSWIFSMLLLYILWDDWQIFMISGSNEQLHQELEYIPLKPDCHSLCYILPLDRAVNQEMNLCK